MINLVHHQYSLVFSSWTATLDLFGQQLSAKGIPYLRIDGNIPLTQRFQIVSDFKGDDARVLLMTVQSGAVG